MAKAQAVRYYNMLIHLLKNNKLFEENVAIKNVWQKDGNTFLDIYFYRNQKAYVFDALFVHDILDLTNEKYYKDIESFVADFRQQDPEEATATTEPSLIIDKNIFQSIDVDLVVLVFMAMCGNNCNQIKKDIIHKYIRRYIPPTANLADQYLEAYLKGINPTEEDFYQALGVINPRSVEAAENLCRELFKVCMADGELRYLEKMYLAEVIQTLRVQGVRIDIAT